MALIGSGENVEIPHEEGNHLVLRALTGAGLDECERAARAESSRDSMAVLAGLASMPESVLKMINSAQRQDDQGVEHEVNLHKPTALRLGVIGWGGPLYAEKFTPDSSANLDRRTADWAFEEIKQRSVRPPANAHS